MTSAACRLRALLAGDGPVIAPGCWDATTARLVERGGFPVAYVSGATAAAVRLGKPDLGFAGLTDLLEVARVVCAATTLPVVADADAGFGDRIHVAHTVERYAAAGLAGLHLEDQVLPKRCGHLAGVRVVDTETAVDRVTAAAAVGADIVVIARTDALGVNGAGDALDRARRYADAGADAVFIEGIRTADEIAAVTAAVSVPVVVSLSEAGGPPGLTPHAAAVAGAALVIVPVRGLLAALGAFAAELGAIATGEPCPPSPFVWADLTDALGLPDLIESIDRSAAGPRTDHRS